MKSLSQVLIVLTLKLNSMNHRINITKCIFEGVTGISFTEIEILMNYMSST